MSAQQPYGRQFQILDLSSAILTNSNATRAIDERLARRLLMCHDRSQTNAIALAHEFMST